MSSGRLLETIISAGFLDIERMSWFSFSKNVYLQKSIYWYYLGEKNEDDEGYEEDAHLYLLRYYERKNLVWKFRLSMYNYAFKWVKMRKYEMRKNIFMVIVIKYRAVYELLNEIYYKTIYNQTDEIIYWKVLIGIF